MQNQQVQTVENAPQRVHQNLVQVHHFGYLIPLPKTVTIFTYSTKFSDSKKKKKIKHKFQNFTYYSDLNSKDIYKILFINDEKYVDQGKFPFTQPEGKIGMFADLNVKRMKIAEAAYIGHTQNELIIKKIEGVKLGEDGTQFQTVDDNFEVIKIGNQKRFNQFLKLMSMNKNSISMSIRVMIDETDTKNPQVIDYEFFYRQKQLIKKHQVTKKQ